MSLPCAQRLLHGTSQALVRNLVRRRRINVPNTSSLLLPHHAASFTAAAAAAASSTTAELGRVVKLSSNSRLANREDVKAAVTTALEGGQVKSLDPILFKGLYPSNTWLVELPTREAAQRLVRHGQLQAVGGAMKVEELREEEVARLQLASDQGLDDCCIQVQHVPAGMGVDEVAYFFRNFHIAPEGIRRVETGMRRASMAWHKKTGGGRMDSSLFLVRFDNVDEAQRAIRERQFEKWGDRRIQLIPYK